DTPYIGRRHDLTRHRSRSAYRIALSTRQSIHAAPPSTTTKPMTANTYIAVRYHSRSSHIALAPVSCHCRQHNIQRQPDRIQGCRGFHDARQKPPSPDERPRPHFPPPSPRRAAFRASYRSRLSYITDRITATRTVCPVASWWRAATPSALRLWSSQPQSSHKAKQSGFVYQ